MQPDESKRLYLLELLKESYECVGMAISVELEYADYKRIEDLKILRSKIEKELSDID